MAKGEEVDFVIALLSAHDWVGSKGRGERRRVKKCVRDRALDDRHEKTECAASRQVFPYTMTFNSDQKKGGSEKSRAGRGVENKTERIARGRPTFRPRHQRSVR